MIWDYVAHYNHGFLTICHPIELFFANLKKFANFGPGPDWTVRANFGFFWWPDGPSEQILAFSVHVCCDPNIQIEVLENLSIHNTQIFGNFHLALSPIIRGPVPLPLESGVRDDHSSAKWGDQRAIARWNRTPDYRWQGQMTV